MLFLVNTFNEIDILQTLSGFGITKQTVKSPRIQFFFVNENYLQLLTGKQKRISWICTFC
jgi:hypothetical protein